ncbi:MAG: acyl-CoA thioesterase [Haloarculaceae archaeon]
MDADVDTDALEDVFENRVRFAETDAQGIVFYGNYTVFQDETVTEFLRRVGYGYDDMARDGWDIHVVNVDLSYRGQATVGDVIVNGVRVVEIGRSSVDFAYAARANETGDLLVEGSVTHVAVDEEGTPTRVPDGFREAVLDFQRVPPESY